MEAVNSGQNPASRNEVRQLYRQLGTLGDDVAAFSEELHQRPEVRIINKYALIMAYIRMGMKGIGALMLLWATVVLLGGFVSDLTKNDFWYLTIIAFMQAAGLSEAMADSRLDFFRYWVGSLMTNFPYLGEKHHDESTQIPMEQPAKKVMRILCLKAAYIILIMMFAPVVYFAILGPILCITLSALRLAKQDYGIADGDASKANLEPALNLFYGVSLSQSAISFFCMLGRLCFEHKMVGTVARQNGLSREVVHAYLGKTKELCLNNPASTASWNLITYGADLLDSQLPEDNVSGGMVLTMLIDQDTPVPVTRLLIRSPRQRIQKLIGTLAWRSPAEQEMRLLAARIVEHLAGHINLAHFPGALECISSLFETLCHNNADQEALTFVSDHIEQTKSTVICEILVLTGLRILENLAHDRHNCTLIYGTKDLLSKIVAPVSSKEFVQDIKSNAAWTNVTHRSLEVVSQPMSSPGSTGEEMHSLIANDRNVVQNLEAVLDMDMKTNNSIIELQMRVIEVLTQLALHHPANTCAEKLIERALHIFLTADWMEDYLEYEKRMIEDQTTSNVVKEKKMKEAKETACRLKEKAGKALVMLSSDSETIKSFTGCKDDDFNGLTQMLVNKIKTTESRISATDTGHIETAIGCRIIAVVILKHLSNYVNEPTLSKILVELLPEVSSTTTPMCWELAITCITAIRNDTENPSGSVQDESHHIQQYRGVWGRLQAELLSLVTTIRANISLDFEAMVMSQTPPAALEDFVAGLKKMVERNMYATPACLAIQKLTCEIVLEYLRHNQNVEVIDKHRIVGTLLNASMTMAGLESIMLFAGADRGCHGVPVKPLSSVLAKNAEDRLAQRKQALGIGIAPASAPVP
ncbi:hypothetical protein VPH35_032755 [Triticum aestivum]